MNFEELLRARRDKDKATTAAILGLKAELDRLELDGSPARTEEALALARRWLAEFNLPQLDEKTKQSILTAAEVAVRQKAAEAFKAAGTQDGAVH